MPRAPLTSGAVEVPMALTKLRPPVVRSAPVRRARLLDGLSRAVGHGAVVVVVAPAGSGKTTLVSDWSESSPVPVAWVNLDDRDNDPVRFWTALCGALGSAVPRLDSLFHLARSPAGRPSDVVVPRLVNEAVAMSAPLTIVLDDVHVLTDKEVLDGIDLLCAALPPQLTVVLLSRHEPALSLSRFRVDGRVIEYRMDDLQFTLDEADSFFADREEIELAPSLVALLWERTEGWAAGLQLAGSALRRSDDPPGLVERFHGANRLVVDYLTTELLGTLDGELREFLVDTSILEHLSGPLCDAVRDRSGSADLLARLDRRNLMLVPLDHHGEWFRYHHLLGGALRAELEHRRPGIVRELHRRAARWHAENGMVDHAIDHSLAASDSESASQLIVDNGSRTFSRGEIATVERWLDALPSSSFESSPSLTLLRTWVHLLRGEIDQAEWWLVQAESDISSLSPGRERDRVGSLAIAPRISLCLAQGDAGCAHRLARRIVSERTRASLDCVLAMGLGYAHVWAGDHEAARPLLARAVEYGPVGGQHLAGASAAGALAFVALAANEHELALHHCRLALSMAEENHLLEYPQICLAHAVAAVAGDSNRAALRHGERAVTLAQRGGEPLPLSVALASLAGTQQRAGELDTAIRLAAEARTLLGRCPDPGFASVYLARVEARFRLPVADEPVGHLVDPLTRRELALLRLMPGSATLRELAAELDISHNTAKTYAKAIYRKLGANGRRQAVERATDLRLL